MTTPTTTETEDISTRLTVLETEVRNINTRLDDTNSLLERMHSEQQVENRAMRSEFQAENQAMRAEFQAELRAVNDRIDRLASRIERVFWAVVAAAVTVTTALIALIGVLLAIVLTA